MTVLEHSILNKHFKLLLLTNDLMKKDQKTVFPFLPTFCLLFINISFLKYPIKHRDSEQSWVLIAIYNISSAGINTVCLFSREVNLLHNLAFWGRKCLYREVVSLERLYISHYIHVVQKSEFITSQLIRVITCYRAKCCKAAMFLPWVCHIVIGRHVHCFALDNLLHSLIHEIKIICLWKIKW